MLQKHEDLKLIYTACYYHEKLQQILFIFVFKMYCCLLQRFTQIRNKKKISTETQHFL